MTSRVPDVVSKIGDLAEAFSAVIQKVDSHGSAVEAMSRAISGLRTTVAGAVEAMQSRFPASGSDEQDGRDADNTGEPPVDGSDGPAVAARGALGAHDLASRPKVRKVGSKEGDVKGDLKTASLKARAAESARVSAMVVGQHHMLSIRRKLSEFVTQSIKNSEKSADVYMDGTSYSEKIKECVKEQLGGDDAAVNERLSSDIIKHTKGTANKKKDIGKVAR